MRNRGKHCQVCGKGRIQRNLVSHAINTNVRYAKPNLRRMRVSAKGKVATIWICAKCLKKGKAVPVLPRRITRPQSAQLDG